MGGEAQNGLQHPAQVGLNPVLANGVDGETWRVRQSRQWVNGSWVTLCLSMTHQPQLSQLK